MIKRIPAEIARPSKPAGRWFYDERAALEAAGLRE
jgi:hypothetical protein